MSLQNTSVFTTSLAISTTFQTLGSLLQADGLPGAGLDAQMSQPSFIRNEDVSITIYVASGYSTIPSGSICPIDPQDTIELVAGLNLNEIWVKSASGTPNISFAVGSTGYNITKLTGISTVSGTTNVLAKFDASDDLVDSSITDTGTAVTIAADVSVTGTIESDDATTPIISTSAGNTNTGYLQLAGKTSGALKLLPADSAAQTVTVSLAAQTSGASTLTIPDQAGVSSSFVFTSLAQTLTNKTLTSPVIATINSDLSVTGTVESADPTTPILSTATGKTNTGYLSLTGKTSGSFKILPADAVGQLVTMDIPAQTSGASIISLPDFAGVNDEFTFKTKSQTMSNKTFVTPVLGVATGTSLAVTGLLRTSSPTVGMGYATGAGAAVAQGTSRTTGVTIDTPTGAITLFSAAGSATPFSFTVTNASVAATDTIIVSQKSGTDIYTTQVVSAVGAGSFRLTLANASGTTTETPVFNFCVLKGVAS